MNNANDRLPSSANDGGNDVPWLIHDCGRCVFLGPCTTCEGIFELYFCAAHHADWPTLIARYGDSGAFIAGFHLADYCAALTEARRRAIARGLIHSG